jgi:hypothetical protein
MSASGVFNLLWCRLRAFSFSRRLSIGGIQIWDAPALGLIRKSERAVVAQPETGVVLAILDFSRSPARRALRMAILSLLTFRTGGGTATTFTSGRTRQSVSGASIGCSRDRGVLFNPQPASLSQTASRPAPLCS